MVIDIDSFLDEFEKNKDLNKKVKAVENKENINLDFQKDVETKLLKAKELGISSKDYNLLFKIYSQLKNFDQDLLNKFYGIEEESSSTLKVLGEKYSAKFIEELNKQDKTISSIINTHFEKFELLLNEKKFFEALSELKVIENYLSKYPKYLFEKKIEIENTYLSLEEKLYLNLEKYKDTELKNFKLKLKNDLFELKKLITENSNMERVISKYAEIKTSISNLDKIFYSELDVEFRAFSKLSRLYNQYLLKQNKRVFYEIKIEIEKLFDKFHKFYTESNLKGVLTTYDEIVILFQKLPDSLFEEKASIYSQILNLYSGIDKLVIKSNISLFMESFNASKIIDEVRFYLNSVKKTKKVNPEIIDNLVRKVNSLPSSYDYEKNYLLKKLEKLKNFGGEENNNFKSINNEVREKVVNNITDKKKKSKIKDDFSYLKQKLSKQDVNLLKELDKLYAEIKIEKDPNKLKVKYKKILFYVDLLKLSKEDKNLVLSQIKKEILNKSLK